MEGTWKAHGRHMEGTWKAHGNGVCSLVVRDCYACHSAGMSNAKSTFCVQRLPAAKGLRRFRQSRRPAVRAAAKSVGQQELRGRSSFTHLSTIPHSGNQSGLFHSDGNSQSDGAQRTISRITRCMAHSSHRPSSSIGTVNGVPHGILHHSAVLSLPFPSKGAQP
jgi:hypothetical protein